MIIGNLSGGQRFWLIFTTVLLASASALIAVAWPKSDPAVLADLRSPECAAWRGLPAGTVVELYPNPGEQCYALRRLLVEQRIIVRDEGGYDDYLLGQRAGTAFRILSWWAAVSLGVYALGWASVKLVRKLWPASGQKAT